MDQRHHLFCVILKARITSIKWIETSFETISIFGRLQNEEKFMEKKKLFKTYIPFIIIYRILKKESFAQANHEYSFQ